MNPTQAARSWYREPWPWILFGLPASAVVAGVITLVIAVKNEDGLVAQDYYKQGLTINRVLARESRAVNLGLSAELRFDDGLARVRLSGDYGLPPTLSLRFVHPTRSGEDRNLTMARVSGGEYQAPAPVLGSGYWIVQLEDSESTWRLSGDRWRTGETLILGSTDSRRDPRKL